MKLDPEDIRYLHDEQIRLYSGVYGENEPHLINYIADKPFLVLYGQEKYPSVFQKAAVYLDSFAKGQYFADGNKRTGLICALTFLAINGYQLKVDNFELYKFTLFVAESSDPTNDMEEMDIDEIAKWFEENSIVENSSYF